MNSANRLFISIAIALIILLITTVLLFNVKSNQYALHWAVYDADDSATVRAMLSSGADPNLKVKCNYTTRCRFRISSKFPYILSFDKQEWLQGTPLHVACTNRGKSIDDASEIVKLLIASGANINMANSCGLLPINLAIQREKASIISLLIKAGASPYIDKIIQTPEGARYYTCPVLSVIEKNNFELLKIVINESVLTEHEINNIYIRGDETFTLLDFAEQNASNNNEIIELIRKHGGKLISELHKQEATAPLPVPRTVEK